ncbi:hypothetical protein ACVW1A_004956 [Bradyrhizobium sp. LB1.3]
MRDATTFIELLRTDLVDATILGLHDLKQMGVQTEQSSTNALFAGCPKGL